MKKNILLVSMLFSSLLYAKSNEEMVMEDIQNLRLSKCKQSFTVSQIATYDVVFGFHLAISSVSKGAYDLSLAYATETANDRTCKNGEEWIRAIKNKFKE